MLEALAPRLGSPLIPGHNFLCGPGSGRTDPGAAWGREGAPSPDGVCSAFSPAASELGAWQGWGRGLPGLHGHPGAMPVAPLVEQEEQTGTRATVGHRCAGVRYVVGCRAPKRCKYAVQLAKAIIYLACLCHKKTTMDSGQRFGSHLHLLI